MKMETLITVMIILVSIFTLLTIYWIIMARKLFRRYDMFMRGKDATTLEDTIGGLLERMDNMETQDLANKDVIRVINRQLVNSYQKTGVVKYNAFEGMGGQSSCALTLLDLNNNGILLDVIHSRNTCYTYIKEIKGGECEAVLSMEEKASLMMALKKKDRFFNPDESVLEE